VGIRRLFFLLPSVPELPHCLLVFPHSLVLRAGQSPDLLALPKSGSIWRNAHHRYRSLQMLTPDISKLCNRNTLANERGCFYRDGISADKLLGSIPNYTLATRTIAIASAQTTNVVTFRFTTSMCASPIVLGYRPKTAILS
jgi:hypothetical protein